MIVCTIEIVFQANLFDRQKAHVLGSLSSSDGGSVEFDNRYVFKIHKSIDLSLVCIHMEQET